MCTDVDMYVRAYVCVCAHACMNAFMGSWWIMDRLRPSLGNEQAPGTTGEVRGYVSPVRARNTARHIPHGVSSGCSGFHYRV